ncbi:hypothetical protein BDZ91DRAFT_721320 [Kalaharituber pfeilii]|nr:hypothetical protein BDZ91DRAFT_721320 [Kalaharituber pfeilii]
MFWAACRHRSTVPRAGALSTFLIRQVGVEGCHGCMRGIPTSIVERVWCCYIIHLLFASIHFRTVVRTKVTVCYTR